MKLAGLHHVTMITGDAQENVRFYADLLGLRFVKKTVNFDAPEAYHLYFGDEQGTPGSILTWFEFPGAARGRAGVGMIHTLQLGVASEASLDFWEERLGRGTRGEGSLRFEDYDGLGLELVVADAATRRCAPRTRRSRPSTPSSASRAPAPTPSTPASRSACSPTCSASAYEDGGEYRPERLRARASAGPTTPRPRRAACRAPAPSTTSPGPRPTTSSSPGSSGSARPAATSPPVQDRDYFLSIYFREPRGVLFEIATLSPGFAVDEDPDHLGEELRLPKQHEHLRSHLEQVLRPVENPRRVTA